jgi:OmpR family response regulator RpaB
MSQEGKCLSRTKILKEVWDYVAENYNETRIVDVHISRLRSKLEDDPSNPTFILTSRGNGYFFQKNE